MTYTANAPLKRIASRLKTSFRASLMTFVPAMAFVQCAGAYAESSIKEVATGSIIKNNLPVLIPEDLEASAQVYMYEFSYDSPAVTFELSSASNMKLQIRENDLPTGTEFDCEADTQTGKASCEIQHRGGVVFVKVLPVDAISNGAILSSHFSAGQDNGIKIAGSF